MRQLVLVSHGCFCEELKHSTEMIMGPQANIHTVALLPEEGPDDFRKKFENTISNFDDFVVFADLLGGTPANVVSRFLMEGANFDLYTGMNLPMVIGFLNGVLLGEAVNYVEFGASSIQHVNALLENTDDDEDE